MRSSQPDPGDDLTTRARIRDTALRLFAEHGIAGTSLRSVAREAGVASSHVVHYFGSKAGLRAACDRYVIEMVRARQSAVAARGLDLDVVGTLRDAAPREQPLLAYLSKALVEPSAETNELVDLLVANAIAYLDKLVEAGVVKPTRDQRSRAVLISLWSLGALALKDQLSRLAGVDLTEAPAASDSWVAYAAAMSEIFGPAFFTEDAMARFSATFADGTPREDG